MSIKIGTKNENNIYIRILLWAHDKQETGFTWAELKKEFKLSNLQESWVKNIFLTTSDTDRKFFEILRNDETNIPNVYYYSLNEKGMATAVNYRSLKQAEKSSKYALWFSGLALLISAWQFILPVSFNVGHCYVGATAGDKIIRMNCPNWIKIGKMINFSWDSSYDIK